MYVKVFYKLIILDSFFFFVLCTINCPPDNSKYIDSKWERDPTNENESLYGFLNRNCIGNTPYEDKWSGIIYENIETICYKRDFILPEFRIGFKKIPAKHSILNNKNMTIIHSDFFSDTDPNILGLYENFCPNQGHDGCYIPINFTARESNIEFDIIFDIVNENNISVDFEFFLHNGRFPIISLPDQFEDINNNVYTGTITANTVSQVKITISMEFKNLDAGLIITENGPFDNPSYYYTNTTDRPLNSNILLFFRSKKNSLFSDHELGIATYSIMNRKKNANILTYNGIINTCENNEKCIENYSCFGQICTQCIDKGCLKCEESILKCSKCPPTSSEWNAKQPEGNKCKIDFLDFTTITKVEFPDPTNVPPAVNWRFTVEFWTFINNPVNLLKRQMNIIYKDFLTSTIAYDLDYRDEYNLNKVVNENATLSVCTPIEWLYKVYAENVGDSIITYLQDIGAFYLTYINENVQAKWFHTRCAFNFDTNKAYINDLYPREIKIPQIYNDQNDFPFQMKKFYKKDQFTDIIFEFATQQNPFMDSQYLYFRNLNIFREYMPQNIITKYQNLHLFITGHSLFPQLLFILPLDGFDPTNDRRYNFTTYNYYNRESNEDPPVIRTDNYITLDPEFTLLPPRNFKRLNLLNRNKQAQTCDYHNFIDFESCGENGDLCFEEGMPFSCIENQILPYYLNINDLTCHNQCPQYFYYPPKDHSYNYRNWCSAICDSGIEVCPWGQNHYQDITSYTCYEDHFEFYYHCYKKDAEIVKNSAMYFGYTLNSHSIKIDVGKAYDSYMIEVWIYPDQRFLFDINHSPPTDRENLLKKLEEEVLQERTLFMTDKFRVQYNDGGKSGKIIFGGDERKTSDEFSKSGWNHFVVSVDKLVGGTSFYSSFGNDLYNNGKSGNSLLTSQNTETAPADYKFSTIIFCNEDKEFPKADCSNIKWFDAYYRDLRVWDLTYTTRYAIFYAFQFDSTGSIMLKNHYPLRLNTIAKNNIADIVSGKNGYIPFNSQTLNPDNANLMNYEAYFDYEHFTSKQHSGVELSKEKGKKLTVEVQSSQEFKEGCKLSRPNSCFSCVEGNALLDKQCTNKYSYYTYKNPGINMPSKLSLNINARELAKEKYITLFFFIKVYGFNRTPNINQNDEYNKDDHIEDNTKFIIFNTEDKFFLAYDPSPDKQSLYIYFQNRRLWEYDAYREDYFGHWVPISIAIFREVEPIKRVNMAHCSILYTNMQMKDTNAINMPYLIINEFTITSTWVGLLSDVKIYKSFIIDSWGLVKTDNQIDIKKYIFLEILLRTSSRDKICLQKKDILSTTDDNYQMECVFDHNPHWTMCSNDNQNNFVPWDRTRNCQGSCWGDRCLGNDAGGGNNPSCENVDLRWRTWYNIYTDNRIDCEKMYALDWARFKPVVIENLQFPVAVFNIDFWFYTQTVYTKNHKDERVNNFKNFILTWNFHMRIKVESIKQSILSEDNTYKYKATCTPVINILHPEKDPEFSNVLELGDIHMKWTYISCGVDMTENKTFITNSMAVQNENFFIPKNTIPLNFSSLKIEENSPNAYGITHIREIRLWKCYSCSIAYKHTEYDEKDYNFNTLLHCYRGRHEDVEASNNYELYIRDEANRANDSTKARLYEIEEFYGYNIFDRIGGYLYCDESLYQYLLPDESGCFFHYNLARFNNFEFLIPSSRTGRYTMEFWAFVEESNSFSSGINIIWENHMSISLMGGSNEDPSVLALCFPQAYRDKVYGLKGADLLKVYNKAINKDQYNYPLVNQIWIFVRCTMDQSRKIYRMNDNYQNVLLAEPLYGGTRNYRAYRYYNIGPTSILTVQNAKDNYTRIFLRSLRCYREFIDQKLDEIKYIDVRKNSNDFWPLVFYCDFTEVDANGLKFSTYEENGNSNNAKSHSLGSFLEGDNDPYYPTYPHKLYKQNFCNPGQNGGNNETCTEGSCTFCLQGKTTKFYYPPKNNMYLNMETLEAETTCQSGTRVYTRLPDSRPERAYCLRECTKETDQKTNIESCSYLENKINNLQQYTTEYKCDEGFTRVYYECIENELIPDSAIYFSHDFSFNNMIIDTNIGDLNSYYFEFWFKLDQANYHDEISEQHTYLLAPPHLIIQDRTDQKFKYANLNLSSGTLLFPLNSISLYEWNRVIIENKLETIQKKNIFTITVYLNYEFNSPEVIIPNLDKNAYDMSLKGIGFCDRPGSNCKIDGIVYNRVWGIAWYRNVRIWNELSTSLELIQACEVGYTQLIKAQYYYFSLTIDSIESNTILDRTDPNSKKFTCEFWYDSPRQNYDNEMRENYSTNKFDYAGLNPGNFISGLSGEQNDYQLSSCATACKRCYSASSSNCYECMPGYALYGKTCKPVTGYYFKTPTDNLNIDKVSINTNIIDKEFFIETQNPLTFTIWIKYFGIRLEENAINNYFPLIYFFSGNSCQSFLGYNEIKEEFALQICKEKTNPLIAFTKKIKEYVGRWVHFGFNFYRSEDQYRDIFPHMFNFMIDQVIQVPINGFDPEKDPVYVNTISFGMKPVALFSNIKFYKKFWFGTYGHINALLSTRNIDLIHELQLYGSAEDNCISQSELDSSQNINDIRPVCVGDYHPYDDTNNRCTVDTNFIDLNIPAFPPCDKCDDSCVTQCFDNTLYGCSSKHDEGIYWIETQNPIQSFHSQKIDSINFAIYKDVNITHLNLTKNDEITMEFWMNIYEYIKGGFNSIDIFWEPQVYISIVNNDTSLTANCKPYTNDNSIQISIHGFEKGKWNRLVCSVDIFDDIPTERPNYHQHRRFQFGQDWQFYQPVPHNFIDANLLISDKSRTNYGFSFIRELKLFSSFNYDFWDSGGHNLSPSNYEYLLHYFKNTFTENDLTKAIMKDEVKEYRYNIELREELQFIGYNYVKGYKYIILCDEGLCYNEVKERCEICIGNQCSIARLITNRCLLCATWSPYLKDDDNCYSKCGDGYYEVDYLKQCRKCHSTCRTCFDKYYNNCITCIDNFYLVADLNICVEHCEDYGLTPYKNEGICGPFKATAVVTPENPIDLFKFEELIAEITSFTGPVTGYKWSLEGYPDNCGAFIGGAELQDGFTLTEFSNKLPPLNVNKNFFENGKTYYFNLTLFSNTNDSHSSSANYSMLFEVYINAKPETGFLNALPSKGYISTTFLFTCNECKDDRTAKNDLTYKFTYSTDPDGLKEVVIHPKDTEFSSTHEVLLNLPNPGDYYIFCYCKDEMEEISFSTNKISVFLPPNEGGETITIIDSLSTLDIGKTDNPLTTEQLSNRMEFLSTLTVDFPKDFILNRTNITSPEGSLILNDPTNKFRDPYCNNRGTSYMIDRFLTCDCTNYHGTVCQVDLTSFNDLINIYQLIYKLSNEAQTNEFDKYIFKTLHLLIKSGSMFFPIEQKEFMLQIIEYISLCMQNFSEDMMKDNNHEVLFDIYNDLLEYGMVMVNDLKLKTFGENNSKKLTGMFDDEQIRKTNLTKIQTESMREYFKKIKMGIENLMKFYANSKFQIKTINKNVNAYVTQLNEDFSFSRYFQLETQIYEPYFDISACISNAMKKTTISGKFKIIMVAIVWKISPFYYLDSLYYDNVSPMISVEFIDEKSLKSVYLSECGEGNEIQLYFPINHYNMVDSINEKKDYVSPENQYDSTDDIFNDPVYINPKGEVFNSTPEERISTFFVPFNFSCKYYEEKEGILVTTGCDYSNYTTNDYIECKCSHLTDFVPVVFEVTGDFHVNTRFFYLKHYMLLAWWGNYPGNQAFYSFVCIVAIYFAMIIAFTLCESYIANKVDLLNFLKISIIKINLPYRERYEFNDNLRLDNEIQQRIDIENKRKPDLHEQNIDINNIDVMVMAEKISKYDQKFEEYRNNGGKYNDFFNSRNEKKPTPQNMPSFFKSIDDEIDSRGEIIEKGDAIDKNQRLNKFYNVGLSGYASREKENENSSPFDFEGKKKMYHNPAPPKKKNQKKEDSMPKSKMVEKQNLAFFGGKKRKKEVITFQEGYDFYNPKFEKPKVVSQKLTFFKKGNFDDISNIFRPIGSKSKDDDGNTINREANLKLGHTKNKNEIDFENEKDDLPKLFKNLTIEKKLLEFSRLTLSFCSFYRKNLFNRYILFTSFARFSSCYSRYMRIGTFMSQIALYALILSIFYTADAKMEILNKGDPFENFLFVIYCIVAAIGSCIMVHLPSFLFYIDVREFRKIYTIISENGALDILKEFDNLVNHRFWWNFLGVFTQWVYILVSFYFSFAFCATYYYQRTTFFLGLIVSIVLDFFVFEFLWELVIAIFYSLKLKGRCFIRIAEFLNRIRTMKTLT